MSFGGAKRRISLDKFVRDSMVERSPRATTSMTIEVMCAASMTPGDWRSNQLPDGYLERLLAPITGLARDSTFHLDSLIEFSNSRTSWQSLHTPRLTGPLAASITQWWWQGASFEFVRTMRAAFSSLLSGHYTGA